MACGLGTGVCFTAVTRNFYYDTNDSFDSRYIAVYVVGQEEQVNRVTQLLLGFVALVMPGTAQFGYFRDGFTASNNGVSIEIISVRTSPRTRAEGTGHWLIRWKTQKRVELAEVSITVAGFDFPVECQTVPGSKLAPLDKHNPLFDIPLATVSQIDFILYKGVKVGRAKEVGRATFKKQ